MYGSLEIGVSKEPNAGLRNQIVKISSGDQITLVDFDRLSSYLIEKE